MCHHGVVELGYPEAQIISFDGERLQEIKYEDTAPMQIVRRFLNDRENFLQELFKETANMFERDFLRTLSGLVSRNPSPYRPPQPQQICLSRHP